MKLLYSGIHKNIGFLIKHKCCGYDKEYHITKISNDLDIDREMISKLFKEASNSNLLQYIDLLENKVPIDKVFELMDKDNEIIKKRLYSSMATIGGIIGGMGNKYLNL